MHKRAYQYVARYSTEQSGRVIEIGSRNINGSVRPLFPNKIWTGLDIVDGPDVDIVTDARDFKPDFMCDMLVCCEVFEHSENWEQILQSGIRWLEKGGRVVLTCAGPGRPVHSAEGKKNLPKGEWYQNITPIRLFHVLGQQGIDVDSIELFNTDVRASGLKR